MVRSGSVRRTAASSSPAAAAVPTAFTASPGDYRLLEEVGYGANAVVYRAVFLPSNRTVAVKCLDLDRVNSNLVSFLSPSLSLDRNSLTRSCPRDSGGDRCFDRGICGRAGEDSMQLSCVCCVKLGQFDPIKVVYSIDQY